MKSYKNFSTKFKAIACTATLLLATIAPSIGAHAATIPANPDPSNIYGQWTIVADDSNPFNETGEGIVRISKNATADDVSVNTANKTVTFKNLDSGRMDIDGDGWTFIFDGTNIIETELIVEDWVNSATIKVLQGSSLTVQDSIGNVVLLGDDTVSSVEIETEEREHTVSYTQYYDPDTGEELNPPVEVTDTYNVISTEGPIKFTNVNDAAKETVTEESGSKESASSEEAKVETTASENSAAEIAEAGATDFNGVYMTSMNDLSNTIKNTSSGIIILTEGTALPKCVMKALAENPNVTLNFIFTKDGVIYNLFISGKDAAKVYREDIEWYGHEFLNKNFGKKK